MSGEDTMVAEWTYEGYWNAVLGDCRDAARVVSEFALVAGLDEWLGQAEVEGVVDLLALPAVLDQHGVLDGLVVQVDDDALP